MNRLGGKCSLGSMRSGLFLVLIFVLLASGCAHHPVRFSEGPKIGLQTWTCRNMGFEEMVVFARRHGLRYLELVANHLDPSAPREEVLRKKAILDRNGLVAYSFGVNLPPVDKEANRQLFEFARLMGIHLIVVEPQDFAAWDGLEALVKEYDIKLAIHNHGLGTPYGDPEVIKRLLVNRDPRIGVCLDVGHVTKAGFDAAVVFREYKNRVFDLHFKDKKLQRVEGKMTWADSMPGQGAVNFKGLFAAIRETGWSGVMAIETDSPEFAANPDALVSESVQYFKANISANDDP
jgi:sugar phosphate isomerase/epimerase